MKKLIFSIMVALSLILCSAPSSACIFDNTVWSARISYWNGVPYIFIEGAHFNPGCVPGYENASLTDIQQNMLPLLQHKIGENGVLGEVQPFESVTATLGSPFTFKFRIRKGNLDLNHVVVQIGVYYEYTIPGNPYIPPIEYYQPYADINLASILPPEEEEGESGGEESVTPPESTPSDTTIAESVDESDETGDIGAPVIPDYTTGETQLPEQSGTAADRGFNSGGCSLMRR